MVPSPQARAAQPAGEGSLQIIWLAVQQVGSRESQKRAKPKRNQGVLGAANAAALSTPVLLTAVT